MISSESVCRGSVSRAQDGIMNHLWGRYTDRGGGVGPCMIIIGIAIFLFIVAFIIFGWFGL